ncbi:hypothetical protein [Sphingomonas faeni]|uniref:hypothetical protein n=1 Tax=Sphingomonas faeni TaxID=185950 RepID=UPI0020C74C08|nr:hypothetical protein [Sphingomonas faeni]MCP8892524.1 hypothetical protein [Sphingomonas faeni]
MDMQPQVKEAFQLARKVQSTLWRLEALSDVLLAQFGGFSFPGQPDLAEEIGKIERLIEIQQDLVEVALGQCEQIEAKSIAVESQS